MLIDIIVTVVVWKYYWMVVCVICSSIARHGC